MTVKIIEPKKKDLEQFVSRLEFDTAIVELTKKVQETMEQYQDFMVLFRSFFDRYNENVRRTNEIIEFLCAEVNKINGITLQNVTIH